ncbi:hypothetical protein LGN09_27360 [Burkholderia cenocepacia]|uniref:hypothetical protein n=1 Tax=Burkholderia cepacia complex TaxID=87882 RepID=UPI001B99A829|nr:MULTISPECIES: hypothetical protein [Burkholderia cepacia complex]MBR8068314.1 hypothetical protein [Burkholderia cenocepacia]MBR8446039.1 hypothetical protein [Burkholderia cenocepacia]MCA8408628.1 hypothetical protein [Burkholderia cenocepacia]MDN7581942.1 hypothetical protein [Burkholderia orbicola]
MIEEKDLAEFCGTILTGVTVGIGSMILLFASGTHILVQCTFQCVEPGNVRHGHGEQATDSLLLFEYLNHTVETAEFDNESTLTLNFGDGKHLKIIPERNGLESYVVTTRFGICPVIAT